MSRKVFKYSAVIASLLLTAFFAGCGSNNKSGDLGGVARVDEALCAQCHGSSREQLTGRVIYDDYSQSVHALNSVGCQDCHGGGAQHNGVGPIPFPSPNQDQCKVCHDSQQLVTKYVGSKHFNVKIENMDGQPCQRCHTHQGAVLASQFGFTGDGTVMAALVNAPGLITNPEPIKCDTCHVTHKPQDLRVDPNWAPSTVVGSAFNTGNAQFKLCTQCHTYINPAGTLAGSGSATSGTVKVGHHETSWYRTIASTHYDNPATHKIEGYGIHTTDPDPCFGCHNHESLTNSNNDPLSATYDPTKTSIYTDWAQSAHAGGILTTKFAAAATFTSKSVAQVDAVMFANVSTGTAWSANRQGSQNCARCHSETGFKDYLTTADVTAATVGVTQTELLTCRGCHSNAANGTLRTLAGTKANTNYTTDLGHTPTTTLLATGYALAYGKKAFPDVAGSNLCITCHDGRTGDPASQITNYNTGAAITSPGSSHDLPAAATMYVKMGFINFSSSTTYQKSLKADLDGGTITSTHRKLGTPAINGDGHNPAFFVKGTLDFNGPCVTCHMTGSHSLKIDQKAITAVCNNCHTSEAGHAITTIADFDTYFLEPQSEVYQNAIGLAYKAFNARQSVITYVNSNGSWSAYETASLSTKATATDWTNAAVAYGSKERMFGALGNVKLFVNEKASYAHARTYTRRLLYDSIDYLDDGALNGSVGTTATTLDPTTFGKGAVAYTDGTLTTLAPGTTESMLFVIGWSRSTGAWNATERP